MKGFPACLEDLKAQGHTLVGCFPLYPPLELLHSFGLTPVVLWGMREDITSLTLSDRHLQPYACGVARCLSELVISRGYELLDALFMYNACDTLRNLPEILQAALIRDGRELPLFRMHIPAVPLERPYAASYLKDRIRLLVRELEAFTGRPFSQERFLKSVSLYSRRRRLCGELEKAAAEGRFNFADCAGIILAGSRMPVEDHIPALESSIQSAGGRDVGGERPGVMLSGILPPPMILLETLEHSGLRVAANDIAALKRSYAYQPAETDDPETYYEDFYRNHYPCTTILPSADRRVDTIRRIVRERDVKGFIFIGEKFCEYEYFEIPEMEKMLRKEGVQVLQLEMSMDDILNLDAYRTRIEAFSEMLCQGRQCKEA